MTLDRRVSSLQPPASSLQPFPVPQNILDALTRVDMPAVPPAAPGREMIEVAGAQVPVFRHGVLVVGSGAAGLRAAIEAKRAGLDVCVATMSPFGGTSACSGSDKQTLHTAGTSNKGDDFVKLAAAIGAGGAMDLDQAYVEAVGSIGAFSALQYLGLPLPTDRFGAVLRYQTDHDEVGRATSCGPRTSRLMVKVLAEEALRLGVPFRRRCEAVRLVEDGGRCLGVIAVDRELGSEANPQGLCLILAGATVLATGGPGELYRDSVYPRHCYGSLGMAIEAGVQVVNLGESQFGIGTRRQEFPWNLSGTYVQVVPRVFSVDAAGIEREFLNDWFRSVREASSNVFRKGYQWPFHASRMLDYKSSLVDLAIHHESRLGRTVCLDFTRNPTGFSLDDLDDDARAYLANNDALLPTPIERLRRMNPLAIELYRMHGTDIATQSLPFNVNNQHMNGGVAVDTWGRASLPGLYALGEVAGTHGVTRPGGAALNAGQVLGVRVARHLASVAPARPDAGVAQAARAAVGESLAIARGARAGLAVASVRDQIQARMSDHAGFICPVAGIAGAKAAATTLRGRVLAEGFQISSPERSAEPFRWRHMALLSEAVLATLDSYVAAGGGSRGARAYCDAAGTRTPAARAVDCTAWRFRDERPEQRQEKITVRWDGTAQVVGREALRGMEDPGRIFFEKNWAPYLTNAVYGDGFVH
jgi:succinate dehydrogenase / fumarate reductase flavoprotein subunit